MPNHKYQMVRQAHHPEPSRRANYNDRSACGGPNNWFLILLEIWILGFICNLVLVICNFRFLRVYVLMSYFCAFCGKKIVLGYFRYLPINEYSIVNPGLSGSGNRLNNDNRTCCIGAALWRHVTLQQ